MPEKTKLLASVITIAGGSLPASGANPWWSMTGGPGGTNAATNVGHQTAFYRPDLVVVTLAVTTWGAVTGVELVAQRNTAEGGAGTWAYVRPAIEVPETLGPDVDLTGGVVVVKDTLGDGNALALPLSIAGFRGASQLRLGLRNAGAGSNAGFACVAHVELVRDSTYP